MSWLKFNRQIEETKAELAVVSTEETELENRVALLRPNSLDPDMIEERARAVLNFADPRDIVILNR